MILLTLVTVLLAFTPLIDLVVVRWMGVPAEVAAWVRQGLKIMSLWSAAIAWRRFLQGVMIRFDQTRKVAWGTVVRLSGTGLTVIYLGLQSDWPGVIIGSVGLMVGVIAEATFATIAVRPILRDELARGSPVRRELPLTYNELFWFHLPLAGTSFFSLLVQPLVAFSLARSSNPMLSLAAWPVVFQFTLVARSAAFALPEVIIALYEGKKTFHPLRRFALTLVAAGTAFMVIAVLTPLASLYLLSIQDLTMPVAAIARAGLILFLPFPALATLIAWLRGLLINQGATRAVNLGMAVNLFITAVLLLIGTLNEWPGIGTAAIALCVAAGVEFLILWWQIGGVLDFRFSLFDLKRGAFQG
jgi:Na+-driven multidrug efflux pump